MIIFLIYLLVSQMLCIKEGFNYQINSYVRPKLRHLRLSKETFMTKANKHIGKVIRKIGIK